MGEVFPLIASSAPHELVMVTIHQSWFKFVFLSIDRLANILQLMACADIALKILARQTYMGDLIFFNARLNVCTNLSAAPFVAGW